MGEPKWVVNIISYVDYNSPHFFKSELHNWVKSEDGLSAKCECGAEMKMWFDDGKSDNELN